MKVQVIGHNLNSRELWKDISCRKRAMGTKSLIFRACSPCNLIEISYDWIWSTAKPNRLKPSTSQPISPIPFQGTISLLDSVCTFVVLFEVVSVSGDNQPFWVVALLLVVRNHTTHNISASALVTICFCIFISGYLMAGHVSHSSPSSYRCVDQNPQHIDMGEENRNTNGALLYFIKPDCYGTQTTGHCPPYDPERQLTCVICTKWCGYKRLLCSYL